MNDDATTRGEIAVLAADFLFDGAALRRDHAIVLRGGKIADMVPRQQLAPALAPEAPALGSLLAPGFVDAQVNGGGGVLLNDAPTQAGIAQIVASHQRLGTTSLLPTLITDTPDVLEKLADAVSTLAMKGVAGFHLEGPFISPARVGIHPPQAVARMDAAGKDALLRFAKIGRSLVTLAPEETPPGFIADLVAAGLRVAAGHTAADASAFRRALDEGLTGVTHLFNAMTPISARAPGIAGVAFDDARVFASLICDGLHVDPLVMRMAYRLMGPERLFFVSDAMPSVGSDQTSFDLLGRTVTLADGKLTSADGTLAGAHLDMASALRNVVLHVGIALGDALTMACVTPAKFLGLEHGLVRGRRADIVELDAGLQVQRVWIGGVSLAA
ncbi:MAG: N-acetylglucosamine-6-phosphate deacetylase [Telmatospirillum sp.]|nr:N-acetylglucosamine-6-phosphate deacetylase [Telmatospirillum sp.]